MRLLFIFCLLTIWLFPTSAQDNCVQPSRVPIGETARITPGDANNVRAEPTRTLTQLASPTPQSIRPLMA